jgi:hypothetical protein
MAILSEITYNRLARSKDIAYLLLLNDYNESVKTGKLVTLKHTTTKIKTRWETEDSSNTSPFTYAALIIGTKSVVISSIRPIERTEYGYMDLEYDSL